MTAQLDGRRVAFLTANEGVERVELSEPWAALTAAGAAAELVAPQEGKVQSFDHLDRAAAFDVDVASADADASRYDALVLPGGVANPDQLRMDQPSLAFIRSFFDQGKPVGVICHGPWTLVEADLVDGRRITSWPSLRTDVTNAGGEWVDAEVVACTNGPNVLISSRNPDDLPAFCRELVTRVAQRQ